MPEAETDNMRKACDLLAEVTAKGLTATAPHEAPYVALSLRIAQIHALLAICQELRGSRASLDVIGGWLHETQATLHALLHALGKRL